MEQIIAELKVQAEREHKKIQSRNSVLQSQSHDTEQHASELKASGSEQRLLDFQPLINGQLQCPRCWVVNGIQTNLRHVGSDDFDVVECKVIGCGFRASVPF